MVELYVNDIENALKNKSYFSALAMSLALPDICGAAEYPNETSTAKRYIEWYNKYLGEYMSDDSGNPYLSGEIVYNLRNTFLHAGSPNIDSNKVKDEANQLDGFGLILGDGTKIWSATLFINTSIVKLRTMIVDVTYLCKTICDRSLWYYKNNTNKFHFDFSIDTQDHFYSGEGKLPSGDPIIEALNQKLEQSGDTRRFQESQDHTTVDVITGDFNYIFSNEELKQKFLNGEKIKLVRTMHTPVITSNTESTVKKESAPKKKTASPSKKKTKPDKREARYALSSISTLRKRSISRKKRLSFRQSSNLRLNNKSTMLL